MKTTRALVSSRPITTVCLSACQLDPHVALHPCLPPVWTLVNFLTSLRLSHIIYGMRSIIAASWCVTKNVVAAPSAALLSAGRLPPICWSQVGPILALVKKMRAGERGIASGQKLSDVGSGSPRPLPWPQFLHTGSQMKAVAGHWWTCSVSVKWTLMISRWYLSVVCDWL